MRLTALLLAFCLVLIGCERAPEASRQMDNYLQRVGRVLDAPWTPFQSQTLSQYRFSERRQRMLPLADQRIGMLELLVESRRCQTLQQSVSQRNSSLGRVMPWSHRLAADGELIQALDDCIEVLRESPERQALLADLQVTATTKREELPAVFWNALNASSELEYYLRFADVPLPVVPEPLSDQQAINALQQLTQLGQALPTRLPPPRPELEAHFQALRHSVRSSELIHSLARLTHTLEQATQMLSSERAKKLCPTGQPTQRSKVLQSWPGYRGFPNRRSSIWTALSAPTTHSGPTINSTWKRIAAPGRKSSGAASPGRGNPAGKLPQNNNRELPKLYCLRKI